MTSDRQQAYLEAMDISVWRLRDGAMAEAALPESALPEVATPKDAEPEIALPNDVEPEDTVAGIEAPEVEVTGAVLPGSPVAIETPGLKLGPGGGGILLLCTVDSDSASRLASDIGRAMGSNPVWAWPVTDANAMPLSNAIEDNLFTTAAIFGDELAGAFFDGELPASLNAAKIVLLPAMQDIQGSAEARKLLWSTLCRSGMVSAGDQHT